MAVFAAGFPSSPADGEEYTNSASGITYKWDASTGVWNVVSTPGSGGGGGGGGTCDVNKDYVDRQDAAEASARSAKDDSLQTQINALGGNGGGGGVTHAELAAETDARIKEDAAIRSEGAVAMQNEATTRLNEDDRLAGLITDNAQAVEALDKRVDGISVGGGGVTPDQLNDEIAARESADNALNALIEAETTAREEADTAIKTRLDEAEGDIDALEANFEKAVIGLGEAGEKLEVELTKYATNDKVDAIEDTLEENERQIKEELDGKQPAGDYLTKEDLDDIDIDYDDSALKDSIAAVDEQTKLNTNKLQAHDNSIQGLQAGVVLDLAALQQSHTVLSEDIADLAAKSEEDDGTLEKEIEEIRADFDKLAEDLADLDGGQIEINLQDYAKKEHVHNAHDINAGKLSHERLTFGHGDTDVARGNHHHDWMMTRQGAQLVSNTGWKIRDGGSPGFLAKSEAVKEAVEKAIVEQGVKSASELDMTKVVLPTDARDSSRTYISIDSTEGLLKLYHLAEPTQDEHAARKCDVTNAVALKSDIGHNHDDLYASEGHNHDSEYSTAGHKHDSRYAKYTGEKQPTFNVQGNNLYVNWS